MEEATNAGGKDLGFLALDASQSPHPCYEPPKTLPWNEQATQRKTVQRDNGSRQEHYLRSSGDKSDHSHVVVNHDSSGKIESAHGAPEKSQR